MDLERRALYNSLRMNWLRGSDMPVEPWQVEDYRNLPLETLFERLKLQDLALDRISFLSLADEFDTPEEMTEGLQADSSPDTMSYDQIYLLIFELWRRLLTEKPCLSIFCDELDHQIFLYDTGQLHNLESIEDILANLGVILDENADSGTDPTIAFETISASCANDVEDFLYDFISEQIDESNESYATELLDEFTDYVKEVKWFDFLRARLALSIDPEASDLSIKQLVREASNQSDLEFNLEILSFLVQAGDKLDFLALAKKTVPLMECEEDFQDLLSICADFYHRLDKEHIEEVIHQILGKRAQRPFEEPINLQDSDIAVLFQTMK